MKKAFAFIFARGGSKELKNKNVKLFNGKPLIYYSIKMAKKSKYIDRVFVSSDSEKILKISKMFGADIIKRPKILAGDKSSEIESWKHAVDYLKKRRILANYFISLPCTSPLRIQKDISQALGKICSSRDLVVGLTKSSKNPYFNMVNLNNKKKIKPVIFNKVFHNRQNLVSVYDLTTIIYACNMNLVNKIKKSIWEVNIKYIKIPKYRSIDIDTKLDFELAEYLHKKYKI